MPALLTEIIILSEQLLTIYLTDEQVIRILKLDRYYLFGGRLVKDLNPFFVIFMHRTSGFS